MKTYLAIQRDGRVTAFEIEHACISRMTVSRILKQVAGVSGVHVAGRFGSSSDIRVAFQYFGLEYVVLEPFGDNSRYWIGPKNPGESVADARDLEDAFKRHRHPFLRATRGACLVAVLVIHIGLSIYNIADVRTCEIEHTCIGSSLAPIEGAIGFPIFFLLSKAPNAFSAGEILVPLILLNSLMVALLVTAIVVTTSRLVRSKT